MNKNVGKGKEISVLVEQAFPTCILVSFQHGEKTFRGVLLDESSQTVIRTSPADVLGKADSPANLGLTTARSTTCQSNVYHTSISRVSTRSSTMMLRDGRTGSSGEITPVHKIRGLVESLKQRPRRQAPATQPGNQNSSTTSPKPKQAEPGNKQSPTPSENKGSITKSVKRNRDGKSIESDESLCKPPKARTKETADAGHILIPQKSEPKVPAMNNESSLAIPLSGCSPLFPVLKLRRTGGSDNSYVAVTVFSSHEGHLKVQGTENPVDSSGETTGTPHGTIEDTTAHKHNTRFKARKETENSQTPLGSGIKLNETSPPISVQNKASLVKVVTESNAGRPAGINTRTHMKGNSSSNAKTSNPILQNSCNAKRQLKPTKVYPRQDMRVGDIVWGKVHGHPWWPGRILGILCQASESDGGCQIVKVAWYGSTTTSDISCSLLLMFQEHFKHLFKKQKKGGYRLAVRQAQQDLAIGMNGTQVMPA